MNMMKQQMKMNRGYVEKFYIFDKTSIFLLLEKIVNDIIIIKKQGGKNGSRVSK